MENVLIVWVWCIAFGFAFGIFRAIYLDIKRYIVSKRGGKNLIIECSKTISPKQEQSSITTTYGSEIMVKYTTV